MTATVPSLCFLLTRFQLGHEGCLTLAAAMFSILPILECRCIYLSSGSSLIWASLLGSRLTGGNKGAQGWIIPPRLTPTPGSILV
jgi:hypothetical protein